MGARQWINNHPRMAISVIVGCCAVVLMLVGLRCARQRCRPTIRILGRRIDGNIWRGEHVELALQP
jgi:hypothetical protein